MTFDLGWPFKVTNVKIANIFLTVSDRHFVIMKHYWEVDIGLSESAKRWPWMTFKVKIASGVTSVRDRSMLAIGHLISFDNLDLQEDWFGAMHESVISATVERLVVTYHRTVHVTLNLIDFFRSISVNIIFKSVFQLFQTNTAQYVCPWACIIQWCTSKHDRNQYVDEILRHQRYIIRK